MRHLRDIRRGVTDGRTDGPSYGDAMTHLKRLTKHLDRSGNALTAHKRQKKQSVTIRPTESRRVHATKNQIVLKSSLISNLV